MAMSYQNHTCTVIAQKCSPYLQTSPKRNYMNVAKKWQNDLSTRKKKNVDADCKCLETGRHTLGLISATSLVLELQQGHVQP